MLVCDSHISFVELKDSWTRWETWQCEQSGLPDRSWGRLHPDSDTEDAASSPAQVRRVAIEGDIDERPISVASCSNRPGP